LVWLIITWNGNLIWSLVVGFDTHVMKLIIF
jgi:hypothetical protein